MEALFAEAYLQPPGRRLNWYERTGRKRATDPAVAAEAAALIAASDEDSPLAGISLTFHDPAEVPSPMVVELLGPWRLLRLLGRGGMGEVYLAERADGTYQQQVAVKLLKRGIDTDAVMRRFMRERRILGRLSHPNIARLFDAGAAPDGRPYLVMELVIGQPIDDWCTSRHLGVRAVLELMVAACEAVHAAHRQQIVHRDLKPSNVLVDEEGTVKLLDFGVAKLLGDDDDEATVTSLGAAPLTPQYAAPEQLLGQPVMPATDVYTLGVLLYELLTGQQPRWHQNALAAMAAMRDARPPTRPSAALRKDSQMMPQAELAALRARAKDLDGDLDQIVLKALEHQPQRRYGSAAELADDLRRHLDGRPVLARPDAWWYAARKFVLRNWVPVSAAAAVTLALVVGLGATLWQAHVADRRAAQLRTVVDFQSAMLKRVDVYTLGTAWIDRMRTRIADKLDKDHPLPAEQAQAALATFNQMSVWSQPSEIARQTLGDYLLAPARAEIGKRFTTDPATAGLLHFSVGQAYADLGEFAEAIQEFGNAIALQTAALGPGHPDTLSSRLSLAIVLGEHNEFAQAAEAALAVAQGRARALGSNHRDTLRARTVYAAMLASMGNNAQALAVTRPLLALQRRQFGNDDVDVLETEYQVTLILSNQGESAAALPLARQVLEARRRILGEDHPDTLKAINSLSNLLFDQGDYAAVRKLDEETLAIRRRVLGDDHPDTLTSLANLAVTLSNLGDKSASLQIRRELWLHYRRALDETNPHSIQNAENYALSLAYEGESGEASAIEQRVLEVRTRILGPEHPDTLYSEGILGEILGEDKQYAAAVPLLRRTLEADRRVMGADHPHTLEIQVGLGIALVRMGDAGAGLKELMAARERLRATRGDDFPEALIASTHIGRAQRLLGDYQASMTQLEANVAAQKSIEGDEHPDTLDSKTELAETLHALHRDEEAQALAASVVDSWRRQAGDLSINTIEAQRALAGYEAALGRGPEAKALRWQADRAEQQLHAKWAAENRNQGKTES